MTDDFKGQLKEYLSENLDIVIDSRYEGNNSNVVRVNILLDGDTVASDFFTLYQN